MTPAALRALLEKATPGPWKWTDGTFLWNESQDIGVLAHKADWSIAPSNAELIVALRTLAPHLLDLWESVEATNSMGKASFAMQAVLRALREEPGA